MRIPPKQVWENGYGWICPYCRKAQDEGEKNTRNVRWKNLIVCQTCAPHVAHLDSGPEVEGAPI